MPVLVPPHTDTAQMGRARVRSVQQSTTSQATEGALALSSTGTRRGQFSCQMMQLCMREAGTCTDPRTAWCRTWRCTSSGRSARRSGTSAQQKKNKQQLSERTSKVLRPDGTPTHERATARTTLRRSSWLRCYCGSEHTQAQKDSTCPYPAPPEVPPRHWPEPPHHPHCGCTLQSAHRIFLALHDSRTSQSSTAQFALGPQSTATRGACAEAQE